MKIFFMLFMIFSTSAWSAPILDTSYANGNLIIFPDHQDSNQFYYLPYQVEIAEKEGIQDMFWREYGVGNCGRVGRMRGECEYRGELNTVLAMKFKEDLLAQNLKDLRRTKPKARLGPVPMQTTSVQFDTFEPSWIQSYHCGEVSGQMGDFIPCKIIFNSNGIQFFKEDAAAGQAMNFSMNYSLRGVVSGLPSAKYKAVELPFSILVTLRVNDLSKLD